MKNKVFVKIKGMYVDPYSIDIDENLEDPMLIKDANILEIPKVDDIEISEEDNSNPKDDDLEVINLGRYGVINGSEYIRFDEINEDSSKIKNTIKIACNEDGAVVVELIKNGAYSTHMIFEAGKKSTTAYETPFGNLLLGIYTKSLRIKREEERIVIKLEYSLDVNYNTVSECSVEIDVLSRLDEEV